MFLQEMHWFPKGIHKVEPSNGGHKFLVKGMGLQIVDFLDIGEF